MAGVKGSTTWAQVQLIAWLRWRLFLSMLRAPGAKGELIARTLVSIAGVLVTLLIAVTVAVVTHMLLRERPRRVSSVFWGIFLVGQFLPLIVSAAHSAFDTRSLLRFPLRFPAFLALGLSYAAFDPAVLASLVWLASAGIGAVFARPAAAPWIITTVALLAISSVLLNRLTLSWAEKLMARRRSREIVFIVFVTAMLSLQLAGAVAQRWGSELAPVVSTVSLYLGVLPPGLAGNVLVASHAAGAAEAWQLFALALYSVLFFWLLRKRMLAQYRGEELSEALVVQARPEDTPRETRTGFAARVLGNQRAALVGKELRYLVRNAVAMLQLGIPFFLILFFGLLGDSKDEELSFFQRNPDAILPSAMGYAILVAMPMAHNCFSFEGRGIQMLFMTPVRFREVLLAKNLALAFALFSQAGLVSVIVHFLFGAQQPAIVAATLAGVAFMLLANFCAGNLLSLYFPRAFDFNSFRQRQSGWSVLVGMNLQVIGMGMVYLVFALAAWWGNRWMAVGALSLMSAAMFQVYLLVLERCDEVAVRQRETLVDQICRGA